MRVFDYKLGNRSDVASVLDQYKESVPSDLTIRKSLMLIAFLKKRRRLLN